MNNKKKAFEKKFVSESLNFNNPLLLTSTFTACFRERFGDTSVWIYEGRSTMRVNKTI